MCLLMGVAQHAYSQAQVAIGIKAGPNFANIDTESSPGVNYKNRAGFHGGAFVLVKGGKIGVQPEVIFSQQGSKVTINNESFSSNFSYVNIPVILKLYAIGGLNIQAGPQFGFVTKGEGPVVEEQLPGTSPGQGNPGTVPTTMADIKDRMKSSDFSLGLGLGWDLPFGLTIDARYNMGLSKVFDKAPTDRVEEAKNQVFQFSVGYKLFKFGN